MGLNASRHALGPHLIVSSKRISIRTLASLIPSCPTWVIREESGEFRLFSHSRLEQMMELEYVIWTIACLCHQHHALCVSFVFLFPSELFKSDRATDLDAYQRQSSHPIPGQA